MGFSFDSLSALLLLAAAIWSWRTARDLRVNIRIHLRFAAVLMAALAPSLLLPVPGLALNVALFAASGAAAALALAVSFQQGAASWISAAGLIAGFGAGLAASLAAEPVLALAGQVTAAAHILAASLSRLGHDRAPAMVASLGGLSLALGGLAMMGGAPAQASLFFAAALGLVSRALQYPVVDPDARVKLPIGGKRA